jgi:hypothetical protein
MPEMAGETTRRGYGHRYQQARKLVLARDVHCTERGCSRRSVQTHHDPPLSERNPPGSDRYNPELMRGVCGTCHHRLTGELQSRRLKRQTATRTFEEEETFPAPAPARPPGKGPPRAWVGQAMIDLEHIGPCEVHYHDGVVVKLRSGERYKRDR